MAFAGEGEERMRDVERFERVLEQDVFEEGDADVGIAADYVGGGGDLVHLEESGLALIELRILPGTSTEVGGIVEGEVVVAPVGCVLDGAGTGNSGAEAGGLGDEPVGH